jgi:UDP-N-acetyl-D-mannosaminuronic acid dehydrogenase
MKKICVLGLGYIGLPTAAMFATHGFQVVGVDVNEWVVETLNNGEVHIQEPGLKTLVQAALKSGNLRVASKPESADAFIIAVPTPLCERVGEQESKGAEGNVALQKKANLNYVIAAAESIVSYLRPGNLVVLESTVPPNTTVEVLVPILERSGLNVSRNAEDHSPQHLGTSTPLLYVAHCPERVLSGRILEELVHNSRVIGGVDRTSAEMAKELYASFVEGEIFLTDATTAEMVKLMENTYRDVNIALANEFALVSEKLGINVWEAIELANRHPRVNILKPGPGVGGHCIPIDPWFIVQVAPELTSLIQTARKVNDSMPLHVVELVKSALAEHKTRNRRQETEDKTPSSVSRPQFARIACLGLAYKARVDDIRESPAIKVVELLRAEGFQVRAYDPHVQMGKVPEQVDSLEAALDGADVVVILTDHPEFRELELRGYVVVDTRNVLDAQPEGNWGLCLKLGKGF